MFKKSFINLVEKFPRIAANLRMIKDALDNDDPHIQTPWGFTLSGHTEMASGNFEPTETALIRSLLSEVDIFVNVGANIGYYCCHALSLRKKTIAIEPNGRNLHYLLNNIRKNNWSKDAQVFPVALGEEAGILPMWGSGTGASLVKGWAANPDTLVKLVPISTLDRILGSELHNKRSLILVDIEGAEKMMLEGASKSLVNNPKPIWIVEIASTEHQPAGVKFNPNFNATFKLFVDRGYKIYAIDEPDKALQLDIISDAEKLKEKFRVNNFIFK